MQSKTYTIYAGVNGAGKTTLYESLVRNSADKRVNSDEILIGHGGDWQNSEDQGQAMREAICRIREYMLNGFSFSQETTLAGRSIVNTILKAKKLGYYVEMFYVGVESADIAVQRVKSRMAKGGHGVPEKIIRRRYEASLHNLSELSCYCDSLALFDNTEKYKCVGILRNGIWLVYEERCIWIRHAFPDVITNGQTENGGVAEPELSQEICRRAERK